MFHLFDIFPILFLTLGPIKTIPVFYQLTLGATPQFRAKLALRATLIATVMCILIAGAGQVVLANWHVSADALLITGGFILFQHALKIVAKTAPSIHETENRRPPQKPSSSLKLAFSPLAAPTIVTPYGLVAILFFMIRTNDYPMLKGQIFALILLMMLFNYVGMLFAHKLMKLVGISVLMLVAWTFAVMQAALGIQVIITAFKHLGLIPVRN